MAPSPHGKVSRRYGSGIVDGSGGPARHLVGIMDEIKEWMEVHSTSSGRVGSWKGSCTGDLYCTYMRHCPSSGR